MTPACSYIYQSSHVSRSLRVHNMKAQAQVVERSKTTMRRPYQRSIVRSSVKQQQRRLGAGNWTPSPSSQAPAPDEAAGWPFRSGNKCFSEAEEELLVKLHALLGNRWSLIAGRLPGRTGKEVESHWNSNMRRKLKRAGVDPDNHCSVTSLLAPADDERQRRRRPLELCEAECPAKRPNHRLSSNDNCVSDAGSHCRPQQGFACGLNLELTLSTPCLYFGEKEQVTEH